MGSETPKPNCSTAHATILMAVHNGEPYLSQQLESIAKQTHEIWTLVAGDDQSTDKSKDILLDFHSRHPNVEIIDSTTRNGPENFMSLLRRSAKMEYIAFSDQDDIWLPDRLSRGLAALEDTEDAPVLYCSRTWIVDENLENPRPSRKITRELSFRNALLQNVVAGNTMLLNRKASQLVTQAAHEAGPVVSHDWWIYQLVTGAGGRVILDEQPTLYYRQHHGNHFGENTSMRSRASRLLYAVGGGLKAWNDMNIRALKSSMHRLTPDNARILQQFEDMRKQPPLGRAAALGKLGLYRQVPIDNLLIRILAFCGRI